MPSILRMSFAALGIGLAGLEPGAAAQSQPVGERHLMATDATASLRDAEHRTSVRVTVWYPAADGSVEQRIDIGPAGNPLFLVGAVAQGAAFQDDRPRPTILLSHGFGGSARMMGWFGLALAQAGYVVIAVDHPGNTGMDKMTAAGAVLHWDRADDLRAALDRAASDAILGPHIDRRRIAVAGFSAGGFTALVSAGGRADPGRLLAFCRANPQDGICLPQKEFALSQEDALRTVSAPDVAAEIAHAGDDRSIPGLRAAFVMAPAIIQEFTPDSLSGIKVPVAIILGDVDPVAPPATNGLVAAKAIPSAELKVLPGVGHYDFLSTCTAAGMAKAPICTAEIPQDATHRSAIDMALAFFQRTLAD